MGKAAVITTIFILVGVVIFGWLGASWLFGASAERVGCVAYFNDVALLGEKAQVTVNGKAVGNVDSLEVVSRKGPDGLDQSRIRVVFDLDAQVASVMRRGSRATIGQESLLGARLVKIVPMTAGGDELPREGDLIVFDTEDYVDMFEKFRDLTTKLDPIVLGINEMVRNLNENVLAKEKVDKIWKVVDDADVLVNDVDRNLNTLTTRFLDEEGLISRGEKLLGDLRELTNQLKGDVTQLRESAQTTMGNADKLMAQAGDTIAGLEGRLKETMTRLDTLLDTTTATVVDVKKGALETMGHADTLLIHSDDLVRSPDLYGSLYELRRLLQESQSLVLSLKADPSQLIWGGPGRVIPAAEDARDETGDRLAGRPKRYGN